jgi:hypothetical protein
MEKTIQWFGQHKATAVLRTNTAEAAPKAMGAAIAAGFKIAEFTLTTPGCLDCVSDFRKSHPDVLIGCGTVMNPTMAAEALDAGAQFLVSPCLIPEVVTYAAERNVVIIPGCQTPTELYNAYLLGAQIQKVFPGALPLPRARLFRYSKGLGCLRVVRNPQLSSDFQFPALFFYLLRIIVNAASVNSFATIAAFLRVSFIGTNASI